MRSLLKSTLEMLTGKVSRPTSKRMGCISLSTEMNSKGDVLLAYIIDPFQRDKTEPVSSSHTHHIESLLIARSFLELGYNVDVIDYRNRHFIPIKAYTFFVSARVFLEVIASRLNPDCTVIAHLDTSHFLANNHAAYARAVALRSRRGVSCPSIRVIEHNKAIEAALYGVVLGNKVTMDTYKYANKKLYSLPIPSPLSFPFPEKDYGECRRHFMWFGSSGFVHKGLDLVLEAFSKMPDLHLHVCGPINEDTDFCNAFRNELFHTPNIHTIGWVSVDSPDFLKITRKCIALVYPSCAEGQAGSVVMCLHAGVIPMVSRESGLDVEDFGVVLDKCNIDEISLQVRHITTLPEHDLEQLTRNAWSYSNSTHTEDNYLMTYQNIIMDIISIGKLK